MDQQKTNACPSPIKIIAVYIIIIIVYIIITVLVAKSEEGHLGGGIIGFGGLMYIMGVGVMLPSLTFITGSALMYSIFIC